MTTVHEIDTTISGTRAREKAYRALALELEHALKREPNAAEGATRSPYDASGLKEYPGD